MKVKVVRWVIIPYIPSDFHKYLYPLSFSGSSISVSVWVIYQLIVGIDNELPNPPNPRSATSWSVGDRCVVGVVVASRPQRIPADDCEDGQSFPQIPNSPSLSDCLIPYIVRHGYSTHDPTTLEDESSRSVAPGTHLTGLPSPQPQIIQISLGREHKVYFTRTTNVGQI